MKGITHSQTPELNHKQILQIGADKQYLQTFRELALKFRFSIRNNLQTVSQ